MNLDLTDRHIVIVGANPAMAEALVSVLSEEGARLTFVNGPDPEFTPSCAQSLPILFHRRQLQLTHSVSARTGVDKLLSELGAIDGIINAGSSFPSRPSPLLSGDSLGASFQLEVVSIVNLIEAVIPSMVGRGKGAIVNISSITARILAFGMTRSAITEGAVAAYTRMLSAEYSARGIRINALMLGLSTDLAGMPADTVNEKYGLVNWSPMTIDAIDIANAAAFLLSDRASFVNGALVPVDGGSSFVG